MKACLAALMMVPASPVLADGWYFEASLEGGAEFWTFTNETGDVSPRRQRGNEIWISRTDEMNGLDANGTCDFNNCTVTVTLAGRAPAAAERVSILFSNGVRLDFAASGSQALMSNYSTAGMGATNLFVHNVRRAVWVEIAFGGMQHRFDLTGSAAALNAIKPYLARG
ncbi:hypothetical protein [Paracoccus sp. (in: a-proteobacteria)]|uniref:hypothetical protein n=1 Tax=Paracoccus sp. TaxID=267 RepID=UPI002AFFD3D3|nr:hypothetical protein [Paracoccus sp. (in: a-proteobacteria)]